MNQETADALRSFKQKSRRAHGELSQDIVAAHLRVKGYRMIEPVYTPWRVIRKMGRIVGAVPVRKVSGDFRAVAPGGRSVLVEVKGRDDGKLPWSAFAPHQRAALDEHAEAGGSSLVAFVRGSDVMIYPWPIEGFGPKKSLTWGLTP